MDASKTDEIVLTDREIAIIEGRDPDEEAKAVESPGEESPHVEETSSEKSEKWYDDDTKAVAESYGFGEDDLKEVGGREEFDRFRRLLDRKLLASKEVSDGKDADPPPAAPVESKTEQPAEARGAPAEDAEDDIDPEKYVKAGYDEDTVRLAKSVKRLSKELSALKQLKGQVEPVLGFQRELMTRVQQQQGELNRRFVVNAFHDAVDTFEDQRLGKSVNGDGEKVDLDPATDANRKKVWEATHAIIEATQRLGQPPPPMKVAVERARNIVFAKELEEDRRREFGDTVRRQAARRRPTPGRTRQTAAPKADQSRAEQVAQDPEIVALYDKYLSDNGA